MPLRLIIIVCTLLTSHPEFPAEPAREVVAMVRPAAAEIHIGGQLRGGGAFVKNIKGKPFVIAAAHLFPNPRVTCFVR
ncbi:hypothetical protein N9E25_01940 [Verrucomicrobiales bacterium]|jgi:hypothetical protein|nr:hypothetical protein [Verrucomicrobiales bacterium]MDB2642350.1 hypothetical protein [bacterium]